MATLTENRLTLIPIVYVSFFVLFLVAIYHSTFTYLYGMWQSDDYTHSFMVPFVIVYLLWERRKTLLSVEIKHSWLGLPFIIAGLILYWLGELGGEYLTLNLSLWLVIAGFAWCLLGSAMLKATSFVWLMLLTMIPLPRFLYNNIAVKLKLISSKIGVDIMQMMGMSAYREGNVIDLGFTQLQVVDACNGLRYLIPLLVLGIIIAYMYKAPLWKKLVLVLSTIPISIMLNSFRIASVGVLYQFWGQVVAEGFFHDFSGWFIFMVSLAILLIEMWLLSKIFVSGKPPTQEGNAASQNPADVVETENMALHSKRDFAVVSPPVLTAFVLLALTLVADTSVAFHERTPVAKPLGLFPAKLGKWSGSPQSMEQRFIDTLDLTDYVMMDYRDPENRNINLYVAYYASQSKGKSIHSPQTCLPAGGWIFEHADRMRLEYAGSQEKQIIVNKAVIRQRDQQMISLYWFPQQGRIITNIFQLKWFTFWNALTRQRTDGALVRIMTPVYSSESVPQTEKRLRAFAKVLLPELDKYLPE